MYVLYNSKRPPPWGFYLLYPAFIARAWAWDWSCGVVWWRYWTGRGRGVSIRRVVNGGSFVLYVWDEPVPLALWQAGAMLLMIAGLVAKAIVEAAARANVQG